MSHARRSHLRTDDHETEISTLAVWQLRGGQEERLGTLELRAVLVAETRSLLRSVRFSVVVLLVLFVGIAFTTIFAVVHYEYSAIYSLAGYVQPRFLISEYGSYPLWVALVGIVFLAYDMRTRDERDGIAEVLDTKPISNLVLVSGRVLSLTLMAWLSILASLIVVQGTGWIALAFDWRIGFLIELNSLVAFALVDTLPVLALWSAIMLCLANALRSHLVVVAVALALLGVLGWASVHIPSYLVTALSIAPISGIASDLAPRFTEVEAMLQRSCLLMIAAGLTVLAAALHRRLDGESWASQLLVAAVPTVIGVLGVLYLVGQAVGDVELRATWMAAHRVEANQAQVNTDIKRIGGRVRIDPGKELGLDVDILLAAPVDPAPLVFSFNPGMRIESLRVDNIAATFKHENGLLIVDADASSKAERTLSLSAVGIPNPNFAYLDSAIDPMLVSAGNWILRFGSEAGLFNTDYVALMPDTFWLPASGVAVDRDAAHRQRDYFNIDLVVEVPSGWLVAGPASRRTLEGGSRFRFQGVAPISEVGLFAAAFISRAVEIAGIDIELLVSPRHLPNIDLFADTATALAARLGEVFDEAERLGLRYPFGSLTIVETPSRLRGYRGGWEANTTQVLPGVLLLKELATPTARFEDTLREVSSEFEGRGPAAVWVLKNHIDSYIVDNLIDGLAQQLFGSVTHATGPGADAINLVCLELTKMIFFPHQAVNPYTLVFSAHLFDTQAAFGGVGEIVVSLTTGYFNFVPSLHDELADLPGTWQRALTTPLSRLDRWGEPRTALRIRALRVGFAASSILSGFGREQTSALLRELRQRYSGRNFEVSDFNSVGEDIGVRIESLIGDWLHEAAMPGFLVSPAVVFRLADADDGTPRYQTRVHVRNDESVPGLVFLSTDQLFLSGERTDPVSIGPRTSVELGTLSTTAPERLWLHSFLSLNRSPVKLLLARPKADQETVPGEGFVGSRPSSWLPQTEGIVVDDLDAGFFTEMEYVDGHLHSGAKTNLDTEVYLDRGLPSFDSMTSRPGEWLRQSVPDAWGKYRRTIVRATVESPSGWSMFRVSLPDAGHWQLDYHIPGQVPVNPGDFMSTVFFDLLGETTMTLRSADGEIAVEFDGRAAESGWNKLGVFYLDQGEVSLRVPNISTGDLVIADAVRWRKMASTRLSRSD